MLGPARFTNDGRLISFRRPVVFAKFSDEFRAKLRALALWDLRAWQDEWLLRLPVRTKVLQ